MAIDFRCVQCGKLLRVGDDAAGRQAQCPQCGSISIVPGPAPAAGGVPPVPEQGTGDLPAAAAQPGGGSPFAPGGLGPFPPADSENPFQSPTQFGEAARAGYSPADLLVLSRVSGPATALIVTAALGATLNLLGLIGNLVSVALVPGGGGMMGQRAGDPMMAMASGAWGIVSGIVGLLMAALIIAGALKMKKLESYGMAMAAAIIAVIPCNCCCVLGLPFGIWALVVLNDANVKAAFRS
jgi:DNA-directed RNA polymerase subunit RPC12/RpoP